ncbi:MAG: Na+/H+ antiporter subunit G [Pseudomonadota bacterium]|nr:Na+/H+ antiporter subunit G [Pseudomonadota bacterium]
MSALFELALVLLLAVGTFFVLVGSFGLVKLSDFFKRLHGPTKATTLGVGCILIASIGHHASLGDGLGLREILITLFLFITAPISAHLMARAALKLHPQQRPEQPAGDDARLDEAPRNERNVADAAAARPQRTPPRR